MTIRPFIEPWQLCAVLAAWIAGSALARAVWGDTTAWRIGSFGCLAGSVAVVTLIRIRRSKKT